MTCTPQNAETSAVSYDDDPFQEQTHHALLFTLRNQDELNQRLSTDWIHMGWDLHRAAMAEAAECLGYLHWAWWKSDQYGKPPHQDKQQQLWMEIVDVFHFLMSIHLRDCYLEIEQQAQAAEPAWDARATARGDIARGYMAAFNTVRPVADGNPLDIAAAAEDLIHVLYHDRANFDSNRSILARFANLCHLAGLSIERLLVYYAGKRALNVFRWNNAYSATGTAHYTKHWLVALGDRGVKEVEDNQVLLGLLEGYMAVTPRSDQLEACSSGELHTLIYGGLTAQWDVHLALTREASPPPCNL